ncbi:hypothetical protein [Aliivibrio fischeri]|uniref:hypothetical protein n=1 Tax=Aliivibrio fischeri TaxID=668 RepID=UPI0006D10DF8|nr:hypothetical protein [Aliivibrio fischeri]USR97219.1 hypothetical protein AVFI_18730 [Aliivibrio fischeri ATCC 7744 = JCM 18803 = DSM 507]USR97221.1 hypothetical protein AVFI_18740 [Aliivibrio fischeri ATCC 7744 = JCM 18803 = DSM 507]GGK48923.1 hypothetical protein GCM10007987_35110 [Aliivibrio fischeri]
MKNSIVNQTTDINPESTSLPFMHKNKSCEKLSSIDLVRERFEHFKESFYEFTESDSKDSISEDAHKLLEELECRLMLCSYGVKVTNNTH